MMAGALSGITVIDFTEYIAGPYCTMMLADMGANVIKVERPEGDAWRHTAPVAPYEGRGYLGVNRAKRSVALDLERAEARDVARWRGSSAKRSSFCRWATIRSSWDGSSTVRSGETLSRSHQAIRDGTTAARSGNRG